MKLTWIAASLTATACAASSSTTVATMPPSTAPAAASAAPASSTPAAAPITPCSAADVPASAPVTLAMPATADACFEPGGDADRYQITAGTSGPQQITIRLAQAPSGTSAFLEPLDGDGKPVRAGTTIMAQANKPATLDLIAKPGETFLLHVYPNVAPREPAAYSIEVRERPLTDPGEPNNDRAAPAALPLGEDFTSALTPRFDDKGEPADDVDYYRVQVDKAGTLRVTLAAQAKDLIPDARILDAKGRKLAEGRTGAETRVQPGAYIIRVARSHYLGVSRAFADRNGDIGHAYRLRAIVE